MRKPRRPRDIDGCSTDVYYEQFAEPGDPPTKTANMEGVHYDASAVDILRKQANWMLKAADWLEGKSK